jgi:hypothetical protein
MIAPAWSRAMDSIPQARPYMDAIAEYMAGRRPARQVETILTVAVSCVVCAQMTGLVRPLVDLDLYLVSWGMPRETARRFCRRLGVAMEVYHDRA